MANQLRPTPLSFDSGRQSPFRRQNSQSPATARPSTPTHSPSKSTSNLSPTKPDSLSPVKNSPFVRRPSQISSNGSGVERPTSPFARPTSGLSIPASPSRQTSNASDASRSEAPKPQSPARQQSKTPSPPVEGQEEEPIASRPLPSHAHLDGTSDPSSIRAPPPSFPSQASLRPAAHRTATSSTTSTIRQPQLVPAPAAGSARTSSSAPRPNGAFPSSAGGNYNHIPNALLRSMRESFEVLDSGNTGTVNSASVSTALSQVGLENDMHLTSFFPPHAPANLNLAKYLDTLSAPLAELSSNEELEAAFEAFDKDDSGQVDVAELRRALLMTAPDVGEEDLRMSEREVDAILGEFSGRRAFGAKGVSSRLGGGGNAKGDVFRWKQFLSAVRGVDGDEGAMPVHVEGVMA